jgi:hypothetical protein
VNHTGAVDNRQVNTYATELNMHECPTLWSLDWEFRCWADSPQLRLHISDHHMEENFASID